MQPDTPRPLIQLQGFTLLEPTRHAEEAVEVVPTERAKRRLVPNQISIGDMDDREFRTLRATTISEADLLEPISVVILAEPGNGVDPRERELTIESVLTQLYPKIELVLEDQDWVYANGFDTEAQIDLRRFEPSGVSLKSSLRSALAEVSCDLTVILRLGDLLSVDALYQLRTRANRYPSSSVFYSDMIHFDATGQRHSPVWHGSWDWLLMLQCNAAEGLVAVRTRSLSNVVIEDVNRFGLLGWSLCLELSGESAITSPIHIPNLLYVKSDHLVRRNPERFTHHAEPIPELEVLQADGVANPPEAYNAQMTALSLVRSFLTERNIAIQVSEVKQQNHLQLVTPPTRFTKVSAIIPTRNAPVLLANLIDSLSDERSLDMEFIIIDDNSDQADAIEFLETIDGGLPPNAKVIRSELGSMNYSKLVNIGREQADGEYLIILSEDVEFASVEALAQMVGLMEFDDIGMVGARLLAPDLLIAHAGLAVGTDRLFRGYLVGSDPRSDDADGIAKLVHRASAVTGALQLVKASIFDHLGGYDSDRFPNCFGDVDFCLRIGQLGYQVVVDTRPVIFKHRRNTNSYVLASHYHLNSWLREQEAFAQRWAGRLVADPFFPRSRDTKLAWEANA